MTKEEFKNEIEQYEKNGYVYVTISMNDLEKIDKKEWNNNFKKFADEIGGGFLVGDFEHGDVMYIFDLKKERTLINAILYGDGFEGGKFVEGIDTIKWNGEANYELWLKIIKSKFKDGGNDKMTKEEFTEKYKGKVKDNAIHKKFFMRDLKNIDIDEYRLRMKQFLELKVVGKSEILGREFGRNGRISYIFDFKNEDTIVVGGLPFNRKILFGSEHDFEDRVVERLDTIKWNDKADYELWAKLIDTEGIEGKQIVDNKVVDESKEKITKKEKEEDKFIGVYNVKDFERALRVIEFRKNKKNITSNEISNLVVLLTDGENLEVICSDGIVTFASSQYIRMRNTEYKIIYAIELEGTLPAMRNVNAIPWWDIETLDVKYIDVDSIMDRTYEPLFNVKRKVLTDVIKEMDRKIKKEKFLDFPIVQIDFGVDDLILSLCDLRKSNSYLDKKIRLKESTLLSLKKSIIGKPMINFSDLKKIIKNYRDREVICLYDVNTKMFKFKSEINDFAFYVPEIEY